MIVEKAYKNLAFLSSPDARTIRILSEYLEPLSRFRRYNVKDFIVLFGSSRAIRREDAEVRLRETRERMAVTDNPQVRQELKAAEMGVRLSRYYEDAMELARMLTEWSKSLGENDRHFIICTGGGPGIMEAANRGASERAGGKSIGLNISLPFEQEPNRYVSEGLAFDFHYFFMRKFWFVYLARALVIFPGGLGTLDELFDVLTLVQTGKTPKIPIVIYGTEFWDEVLNFKALVKWGTISPEDLELIRFMDTPGEAFAYLKAEFEKGLNQEVNR